MTLRGFLFNLMPALRCNSKLFESNDILIEDWRYIVGADYTFSKKHTVGLEYIYNTSKESKPAYLNAIGLKYQIKL